MGWSETYYRDYREQLKREWRERARRFRASADDFFSQLEDEKEELGIDYSRYAELWERIRGALEEDFS